MSANSVIFDLPGPRTRRRVLVATIGTAVVALAVVVLALVQAADRGALDADKWGPLLDPRTDEFALVWPRLLRGLVTTLQAAGVAMVFALVIGVVLAVARLSLGRIGRIPLIGVIELLRGLPVIVTIYFVSVLLPVLGWDPGDFWFVVIGLVAYNCVIISEITRAGIVSLPRGQVEAGLAIGLTPGQTMRSIQLPQAIRVMLPALISQLVVIVKDTALGSILLTGFDDLMRQGSLMRTPLGNSLQMYIVLGLMFVVINFVLDRVAQWVQKRLSRSTSGTKIDVQMSGVDAGRASGTT